MTKAKTNEWLGKHAMFTIPIRGRNQTAFEVEVKILDVRQQYGREDYQVEPVAGRGKAWVQKKALRLIPDRMIAGLWEGVCGECGMAGEHYPTCSRIKIGEPVLTPQEIEWQKFTKKK